MKKITFKELLDENTKLGRARRKQLAANFEEMLRRARTADLAWMEKESMEQKFTSRLDNVFDLDAQRTLRTVLLKTGVSGDFYDKDT